MLPPFFSSERTPYGPKEAIRYTFSEFSTKLFGRWILFSYLCGVFFFLGCAAFRSIRILSDFARDRHDLDEKLPNPQGFVFIHPNVPFMKKSFLLIWLIGYCTGAAAEGYQVNNMSARQSGMGHVGAAMQLGCESIFFNPAATAFQQSHFDLSAGLTGIASNCRFQTLPTVENGYQPGPVEKSHNFATPLHIYFSYKPSDRWAVGLGFYTPDGSSVEWDDNWSGAHLVQKISLAAYTFQPTVSFKICDRLSIGAGLTLTWGNFDLSRSMLPIGGGNRSLAAGFTQLEGLLGMAGGQLGLSPEQIAAYQTQAQAGANYFANNLTDAPIVAARLKGSAGVEIGLNAGALFQINDAWSIGMTWRSRVDMKVGAGHATLDYGSPEAQQYLAFLNQAMTMAGRDAVIPGIDRGTFHAELPLPTSVTWGVSFRPTPEWEFGVDLQWVGWSAYKSLTVAFNEPESGLEPIYSVKNYSNTLAFRFGGEYRACRFATVRAGMYVDESPVSSDYLNPETPSMTKVSYTFGLTLRPAKRMTLDLAYCFISAADPERTGSYPIYSYPDGRLTEVFSGNYKLHANVFSVGVGFHF